MDKISDDDVLPGKKPKSGAEKVEKKEKKEKNRRSQREKAK